MLRFDFLLAFLFTCCSARGSHKARLKLTENAVSFPRGYLNGDASVSTNLFVGADGEIYFGSGQRLFRLQKDYILDLVPVLPCRNGLDSEGSGNIVVMQPGRVGQPVFVCSAHGDDATCCFRAANGSCSDCKREYVKGGEPALLTGDALYTTYSGVGSRNGVYRISDGTVVVPSSQADQTYLKIVERREENPLQDKLYAFYTEKRTDQKPDSDVFIARVSQICMADLGGSKDTLQFQWTSQLSSRLSCGDPGRRLYYTQLLDVAVLKSENGGDDRVYGLFKNGWEIRAVCVYSMRVISEVFSTSPILNLSDSVKERPGECVQDSRKLSPELLKYMKNSPEMVDWVEPIGNSGPLLVSHCHYSHIQVDCVGGTGEQEGHHVLLLSMESGAVHKVLESSSEPFIIAEYHPFTPGTQILSMLLDSTEKKLYVSSSSEVVEIDLRNCSVYGNQCADCVLARDPYCGWDSSRQTCAPHSETTIQDIDDGKFYQCTQGPVTNSGGPGEGDAKTVDVPESSRHYLVCPVCSHHAKYHWLQEGSERESIMDHEQQQLVLLIDGMRSEDEGLYHCESQEGDYQRTVVQRQLRMSSGAVGLRSFGPLALALLLFLCLL